MPQHSDVVLSNTDGSSNKVELTLWKDSTALPQGYSTAVIPFLPGRQPTDDANYQQVDPKIGMTWDASNWVGGFGQDREEQFGASTRYGYSDGVLATFANELTLGYKEESVDMIVQNGRFQENVSGWTDGTETAVRNTAGYEGAGAQVTVSQNTADLTQNYLGTVSVLQGTQITLGARIKRVSGTGSATVKVTDSAGATSGTAITVEAFKAVSVTHTIDAAASSLSFSITFTTLGDVFVVDDIYVEIDGGVSFPAPPQEFGSNLYIPCGRSILKWDSTNSIWLPVYIDASNDITDLDVYEDKLYAGRNTDAPYLYSSDGTTWTSIGGSGNSSYAKYFSKVRNANGDFALAKVRSNQVSLSVTPSSLTSWGAEIKVGEPNHSVTNAFSANDTLIVGKEDGLFVYDRVSNQFRDISPEANLFTDPANFKVAISRANEIFTSAGNRAFFRLPVGQLTGEWTDLSYLFKSAAFVGFSGKVSAITQDVSNIFLAVPADVRAATGSFPYEFPITFTDPDETFILALRRQRNRETGGERYVAHTLTSIKSENVQQMGRFETPTESSLFAFGIYAVNQPRITRMVFPLKHEHPALVGSKATRLSGDFYTSFMDFNFPDRTKTAVKISMESLNVDADHPITIYYKKDNADTDDAFGWTQFGSPITSDGLQTVTASLTSPVTFKRIRFKINFASNDSTSKPPRVQSIVVHSVFTNVDFLEWQLQAKLTDARMTARRLRQVRDTQVLSSTLSNLETLRQEPFVLFTDLDGSQYRARITQKSLAPIGKNRSPMSGAAVERSYLLTLGLSEVKTV